MAQCPKCSGDMYDEAKSQYWNGGKTKDGKTKPLFKCKDKANCDGVIWPPKETKSAPVGPGPQPVPNVAQKASQRALAPLYHACLADAKAICEHHLGKDIATADIVAAAATLFIAATRGDAPLRAPPKPQSAPPNPPLAVPYDDPDPAWMTP